MIRFFISLLLLFSLSAHGATFSTQSFYSRDTNDSSRAYARAAADNSYKYYNNMCWSWWGDYLPGLNKVMWAMWEDVASNNRSWLFAVQSDGTFRTIFSWNGTNFSLHKTATAVLDGSWKHYVVCFANGVQTVKINNVTQTMVQTLAWGGGAAGMHPSGQQVIIGSINPAAPPIDNSTGGNFNNFSMWNKVLSNAEITELYNNGRPGNLAVHSAVANLTNWWRADQTDTVPTLIDSKNGSASNMTITASGTSGVFALSTDHAKVEDYPLPANVLSGVTYDLGTQVGTLNIGASVWDALLTSHNVAGSFGERVQKLLRTSTFRGEK